MTRQMFSFECDDIRKHAYDFRSGQMNESDQKRFKLHLISCQSCTDYLTRLGGMFDAAESVDYSAKIDKNDLFDSIMNALDSPEQENEHREDAFEGSPTLAEMTDEETQALRSTLPLRLGIGGLLLLAAGLLIALATDGMRQRRQLTEDSIIAKKGAAPDPSKSKEKAQTLLSSLAYQASPSNAENLNIYANAEAEWTVKGARKQNFELKEGTVLVEYLPKRGNSSLRLFTNTFTIHVLGTIFYATKETQIVGVIAGKIRVDTAEGTSIVLERGQEYVPGKGVRNTNPSLLKDSERLVDVQRHNRLLSEAQSERKVRSKRGVQSIPQPRLREEASLAISKGNYKKAAKILERMVAELPAEDPENVTIRLDLSRIYIKKLKQPRRAFRHLRAFTKQRPLDAATPSARAEMCRIAKRFKLHEPRVCEK